ncbi:MAG: PfkB family carbohydrate kinase [Ruthenibacterium lactatiformans]
MRNPGGAPANVLAMAAKLGGKTAFIGKVGTTLSGAFLKKTMEDAGVDVRGLRMTREYPRRWPLCS